MANLFVIRGRDQGKKFEFESECRIGRDVSNDLQLLDGEASRQHASISGEDGTWRIADHGSSNGTRVNDQLVQTSPIVTGDRIEIGSTIMIFTALVAGSGSGGGSTFQNFVPQSRSATVGSSSRTRITAFKSSASIKLKQPT